MFIQTNDTNRNNYISYWNICELEYMGTNKLAKAKRFSHDLFVPRSDSSPHDPRMKTFIPYIYSASNKKPS